MGRKVASKLCNKCGKEPKYPSQGLCRKCFFEKIHNKWVANRPPFIPIPDLPDEKWVEIEDARGYMISNLGRIKSLNYYDEPGRHAILKSREARKGGYLKIDLDKYNWRPSVHRLVAKYFVANPLNKQFVNHKDGNKQNNVYSNLEWVTKSENRIHSCYVLGNSIKSVYQINKNTNEIIKKWNSISEAGKTLNINISNITQCAKGNHKSAGGFKWEYA